MPPQDTGELTSQNDFHIGTSGTKERAPDGCALMSFPYSRSKGPDFDDLSALAATPNLQGGLSVGWR